MKTSKAYFERFKKEFLRWREIGESAGMNREAVRIRLPAL